MTKRGNAFTLIEMMICIALVAILVSLPMTAIQGLRGFQRESDYRFALHNARPQLKRVRQLPFDELPPQKLRLDGAGKVRLPYSRVEEVSVRLVSGASLPLKGVEGSEIAVDPSHAGKEVVVDYALPFPDYGESQIVDEGGRVTLLNLPLAGVERVLMARGARLDPVAFQVEDAAGGKVRVSGAPAGTVVLVDYYGGRIKNRIKGRYLDQGLRPTPQPGTRKLIEVGEEYGGAMRLRLQFLKVKS